jgi:predicted NACHT family NTPase
MLILDLLSQKLRTGKCLLLFDALDEVPFERRDRLAEKLNRYARNGDFPKQRD